MDNAKIGTALIGGYVLGRTKKAKLALGLAMALAGSRIKPGQLGRSLAHSPFLNNVNQQVRGELVTAGKAAATTVLNAKAEHLADALHNRTEGIRGGKQHADEEDRAEPPQDEADVPDEERAEPGDGENGAVEENAADDSEPPPRAEKGKTGEREEGSKPRARRTASSSSRSTATPAKKAEGTAKRSTHRTSSSGASKSARSGGTGRRDDG
ncbi:ABC transporter substrate-binding protein [Streptomyces sp. NPDC002825]|uniref:ABC transporter substrate-binding protein n=1 Tax=Streptomyces sp. NPDC002825 TaxID=3154666 RepID=UPI00331B3EBE